MRKNSDTSTTESEISSPCPQFDSSESPSDNPLRSRKLAQSGRDPVRLFQIVVRAQGHHIAEHIISAGSALEAINLVETEYGEPVQLDRVLVANEDGVLHQVLVVKNWHGFTFDARVISSEPPD